MTVKDIVKKYLEENGFDGLAGEECGCGLEDLMRCESGCLECIPAHLRVCTYPECRDCPCFVEYVKEPHGCMDGYPSPGSNIYIPDEQSPEVEDIVKDYLGLNGFDGLAGEDCGCGMDDLAPCGDLSLDCEPAYKWICDENCEKCPMAGSDYSDGPVYCPMEINKGAEFHSTEKPPEKGKS